MAMTYNQIKKSVLGKNYDVNRNIERRKEEENLSYSEIKSRVLSGGYDFSKVKSRLERKIGFETLRDDITSLNKRLTESATGWQTSETMNTVRSSVDSMQGRLMAYKEYEKLFGGGGDSLKDLRSSYSSVMEDWDGLIEQYSSFKSADEWTANKEYNEGLRTADLGVVQKEITDLEGIYSKAKSYDDKLKGLETGQSAYEANKNRMAGSMPEGYYSKPLTETRGKLNDYLALVGYGSVEEIEKALGEKKVYYNNASRIQELIKLSSVGDISSENYDKDYNKYVESGKALSTERVGGFLNKEYKNHIGHLRANPEMLEAYETATDSQGAALESIMYNNTTYLAAKYMTDEEYNNYSYYLGKGDTEGANRYIELIGDAIRGRQGKAITDNTEGFWSTLNLAYESGIDQFIQGMMNNFNGADYIPTTGIQRASSNVRTEMETEHGNLAKIGYDIVNTGANMMPSILTSTAMNYVAPGSGTFVGAGMMGASARGNAYQEMLNLGYDKKQAHTYANLVGASEAGLQYLLGGISKFGGTSKTVGRLVSQIDNGFARFAIRYSSSMASEGAEEGLQEVLTPMFKNIAAGYDTGAKVDWGEVAYSSLLGGLLGGVMEGPSLATEVSRETRFNNAVGKNIKFNERAGDVLNLASLTPEASEANQTLKQYSEKGINAENISDYKLGNLYGMTMAEAEAVLNSKKSTPEQKAEAQKTLNNLKVYSQGNVESRTGSATNLKKKFVKETYDAEAVDALIESGLESAEGTESHRLATEYKAKVESGKSLSVEEITKLSDANDAQIKAEENADVANELVKRGESKDVAELVTRKIRGEILTTEEATKVAESDVALQYVAEHSNAENVTDELLTMAQSMESKDRALFVALYDGKTDVEAYADAFNLAVMKSENNYSEDDILRTKSVLSGGQIAKIYEDVRIKADKVETDRFKSLVNATADKKFYKGNIDESVIDYNNTSAEGKVNWKDLNTRQRKAVTFMNGFAKATGINLVWTKDDAKANGSYNRATNTLTLDVYAGIDHVDKLSDTIIPTASHELTHWMEKKSPEFFRKVNNLVFSTLYEHDGISEDKRIEKEMARLKMSNPGKKVTEEMARSEIVARACEEVFSKSEQGKKIFNSLSESDQKTFVDKIKEIIQDIVDWISDMLGLYGEDSLRYEARVLHQYQEKLSELVKVWDAMLAESVEVNQALEKSGEFTSIGARDLADLSGAVDLNGEELFQYKAMVEDEERYREMLLEHMDVIGITKQQINDLFDTIDKAVDIISNNLKELDYAWEADINDRAFSPVKPNSDSLYKVSLDFSTLCRKRLLQQTIQQTLQNALNMNLTTKDSIAIRDELIKIQEEGRKIEVACALCYVESARMKSPKQITRFLNEREAVIKEFFANRNEALKPKIKEAEMKARESLAKKHPNGFYGKNDVKLDALTASKSDMKKADADFIRAEEKKVKASYELSESEQAELDVAMGMTVNDFTSAKGLESLAKKHPDLFDAYTSFIRNATHSKGIESDTWWRAGDADSIGDNLIAQMNAENGLRSQSWSDFQVIHLLDYIAATIELSTKGAKRQSYTKVPEYVKLLGNTGDMINLSLIPENVFNGKLSYDGVEGMAYDIALKLRDEYHATVGTICIGINDEQIRMLLADNTIDYVIPYHHSSMSKATRKLMHIPAWESYEKSQSEKKLEDTEAKTMAKKYGVALDKEGMWQKSPKFSEWFNLEEAQQIAKLENEHPSNQEAYKKYGVMYGGYMAMQNAANNYLRLCAERGLAPKFSTDGVDFTQEENYWKLLIDRKMVDNITGEVIEQKAIKPIFSEKSILEILNDELERYPQVKADQEYATRKVTEKFLSGEMKGLDKATMKAIKKPIDNVTEVNILESSRDLDVGETKNVNLTENDLSEYMRTGKTLHTRNKKQRMLESGKKPILTSFAEFQEFISDVIKGKAQGEVRAFKKVGKRLADAIHNKRENLDLFGKYLELNADDIRESYKRHLTPKEKGDIALSEQDFENIPDYLDDFDGVLSVNTYNNKIEVHLYKETAEGYVRILTVVSTERSSLQVTKLIGVSKEKFEQKYAKKIEGNIGSPKSQEDSNPSTTARLTADVPSNDSILNSDRNVKDNFSKEDNLLYSERVDTSVYEMMGELDNLRKENEKIKLEVESLKERLEIEKTITHGNYVDTNKALAAAGHIRNIANSTYDKVKLAKEIKGIYTDLAETPGMKSEALFRRCHEIADNVLKEAKEEVVVNSYFKGVLKDIQSTRISLDDMQKQEAKHLFGDHYNRSFMGRVVIANDGTSLDSQWQEWANRYPDIFNADVNPNDQIGELYDIISTLQDSSETVAEYDAEEKRRWLAHEVLNTFWNLPTVETTADKYTKKIAQLRAEHNRRITEVRDRYKAKLAEQKKADREKFNKIYSDISKRKAEEVALAKAHGREMLEDYKERAEKKTKIQSITSNSLTLNEWLVKNSKDKHIHEAMKGPVLNLLHAINFSSKSMLEKGIPTKKDVSLRKALSAIQTMMIDAESGQELLVELYGHGLNDGIKEMIANVEEITSNFGDNEFILQRMSLSDLDTLDKTVKTIKQAVSKMNKFHTVNHAMGIANLSQNSMQYLDSLGEAKLRDGMRGMVKKSLNWTNTLPHYAFKRYGEGGSKIFKAIQDGWDRFAFNTKQILDYSNEAYTTKEVKAWSEDIKTFKVLIPTKAEEIGVNEPKYQTVSMTVPQIMSLYCLQKRNQARQHLFQGGIRVADFKDSKGRITSQSKGTIFTEKDVQMILDSLTDRQKTVADKLQAFMNTVCAEWGNDVSMARFGYKAFGEENYFPIQSDKNNLRVNDETEQNNSLFRLLNMSFTKSLVENANNRIVISDIFDVFAQHTSDMAKYNALALPVLDAFRWYNYTEKQEMAEGTFETYGVKQSLESAFGKDGQSYFTTFLKDINGQQEADRENISKAFMRNYKIATVGANIRVVALQPTSYVRASAVISNKYLVKALMHKPKRSKAKEHCGIALWKSLGYFDTNIQRGVTSQIKHDDSLKDKVTDFTMKAAGFADEMTWGYLWNAAELEIRDNRKDLKVGSKEFYDTVGKRLREIIYATQVVDSTMTRSQLMRSTKMHDQIMTNFASEPTLSYNMLLDAYTDYSLDARRMGKKEAVKKNASRVARILYAYTMTNAVAALVESVFDAYRDDDDEELTWMKFAQIYLSNFGSDMSITAKLPYIKELHSLIKGYSVSRSEFAWAESSYKAITGIMKNLQGKGQPSATIKNLLKSISYLSSLPIYNIYRDTMAALTKLDLFSAEDLNEMFEDFMD